MLQSGFMGARRQNVDADGKRFVGSEADRGRIVLFDESDQIQTFDLEQVRVHYSIFWPKSSADE